MEDWKVFSNFVAFSEYPNFTLLGVKIKLGHETAHGLNARPTHTEVIMDRKLGIGNSALSFVTFVLSIFTSRDVTTGKI